MTRPTGPVPALVDINSIGRTFTVSAFSQRPALRQKEVRYAIKEEKRVKETSAQIDAFLSFLRDCEQQFHMAEEDERDAYPAEAERREE